MEKPWRVKFRNVDQTYFPQTRVECRYTISGHHKWSSRDWIGLFKAGWASMKDYYTFAWALAPEGYTVGTEVNCSVLFQPSYLPSPGGTAFQFVYIDESGEICAVSPQFTFCAPRPLDELVTLEEERNGAEENEGEDLLLVVPKAQILQSHLDACQQELKQLQKKLDAATEEAKKQRERNETSKMDFEKERAEMKSEIEELRDSLRCSVEKIQQMEEKQKDMLKSSESISAEVSVLLAEGTENQQRIKELEEDLLNLTQQKQETDAELDRMKERVKKMTTQRKDEEDERRNLQTESVQAHEELRVLQERLEASERSTEALRRDLSELGALQSHSHAELHQVRLQAAQMTLQLSQANLALREGQAAWSQERESMRQSAELDKERIQKLSRELQKKEEWLQEERTEREKLELELGNEKDCNRELRASLRAIQKEREQQQLEKQELLDHIHLLQLRMEREADAKWTEAASATLNIESAPSAIETFGHNDLEEPPEIQPLIHKERDEDNQEQTEQESSIGTREQSKSETDRKEMVPVNLGVQDDPNANKDKALILSDIKGHIPSDLADFPLW
ncbi:calcium-binding and coiled-coil domain-containing protein 1b [Pygocentrus nattereri]|uniref:SKICH domain-containing protein n=1 Tax=Pygocentrus nattereri TaxID=42514 RepID=A0A3B4DJ66_PYGNA|nr:calcium-binding and coiled-coil domain-containing protein 1b [Pygocentrus nattereri]XP_017548264.1 calcium-binding and coiled-coil domain-containing protein 1b [Pygocentrus nattereri]